MTVSWSIPEPTTTPTLRMVAFGDSFVLGGGTRKRFAYQAAGLIAAETSDVSDLHVLGINGVSFNFAWSGTDYTYNLTQDVNQRLAPLVSNTALPVWVLLQSGSNGLQIAGHSAATEYTDFQTCFAAIIALGIPANKIIVGAIPPRGSGIESARTTFNASLVSGAASLGHRLARIDLNSNIGVADANSNTAYYQADAVHWNDAGAAIAARIFKDAMYA